MCIWNALCMPNKLYIIIYSSFAINLTISFWFFIVIVVWFIIVVVAVDTDKFVLTKNEKNNYNNSNNELK